MHANRETKNPSQYLEVEFVSALIVLLCGANLNNL